MTREDGIAEARLICEELRGELPDGERYGSVDIARILSQRVRQLEDAVKVAQVALDDWLNTYAADMCDEERVKEARARIAEHGTCGYIAHVQALLRFFLEG